MPQVEVLLKQPHPEQKRFIDSPAKRKVIRGGRRGGKTTGLGIFACLKLLEGRRILYATPTQEQIGKFWWEITAALKPAIDQGIYHQNKTERTITPSAALGVSESRIKAKTAWNADTLRGDFADLLILDEYQLMNPDVWARVGAPMMLDSDGDTVFIYTPEQSAPHAAQLYKKARELQEEAEKKGEVPRWAVFHFTSFDNPYLSEIALDEIIQDMTNLNYRLEILAEDIDDDPRALWSRELLQKTRVLSAPRLDRIVVAVDPPGSVLGECGIVVAGKAMKGDVSHGYVLEDGTLSGSPATWAGQAVALYNKYEADRLVAERNFGGDMVEQTFKGIDPNIPVKLLTASRGKTVRAEPIAGLYEKGRCHQVGEHVKLEDELCLTGDVTVITADGPKALEELVDKELIVLGGDGEWHSATGHYFGKHETHRISISRRGAKRELIATANHDWYVDRSHPSLKFQWANIERLKTKELEAGNRFVTRKRRSLLSHARVDPVGVMAGFVYGDGWELNSSRNSGCGVAFYPHDEDVIPWFGPEVEERLRPFENPLGTLGNRLYGLPLFLKRPPDFSESASYLYGWLAGYFAADGHITKDGQANISSASRESLELARHVATILGIATGVISETRNKGNEKRIVTGHTINTGTVYSLGLISSTLQKSFFLKGYHRERWLAAKKRGFRNWTGRWTIDSIEPNGPADVFCLNVPGDHRFVLAETSIISGNCTWYQTRSKAQPSPNRLDAMVWALSELMLDYCATEIGKIEIPMI